MASLTVKIGEESHEILREIAEQTGDSMQTILANAIEEYRRKQFFNEFNAAYAALQKDPEAWEEELQERKLWESTLSDGLESDEVWTEDGRAPSHG
ncbi:MAG: toxin-antitoxin system protein [Blastocatellia bacterium]|nr:toxin-antitoxin system protein [Blastocatellia bacterium]